MKKKAIILAMVGVMAVSSLTGCGSFKADDVVVTVDKEEVTADIANFYARYTQAQYETYYGAYLGDDMWNSEASEGETYEESVKKSVLEQLETMVLLEKNMSEYDVKLTDEEKALIKETAKTFDEDNALEEKEKVSGSKKAVQRVLTLMAIQTKMMNVIQAKADTEVSDEEAAQKSMQYVAFPYTTTDEEGNSADLSDEEKAAVKAKAETVAQGLKDGGDFAALAGEQSVEVQTATFDAESTSPDADLIAAADALEENGVTDVIETDTGCYVAKVTSLLDREATDSKKEEIVSQRKSDLFTETCDKLRKDADIKVNKKVWKKIDFNDLSVSIKQAEEQPYTDKVQTDDQAEDAADTDAQ